MIKIIKLLILELIVVFTLIIVVPSLMVKEKFIIKDESISVLEPLVQNKTYFQEIPNAYNLNSISVSIKNPSIQNNSQIFINLEDEQHNKLKEFVISGSNVGDPSWVKLKFDPIPHHQLFLNISTENKNPDSLQIYYQNNKFNLQATIKNPSLPSRVKENINYQYLQFTHRSFLYTLSYLILILVLNYLYVKKK